VVSGVAADVAENAAISSSKDTGRLVSPGDCRPELLLAEVERSSRESVVRRMERDLLRERRLIYPTVGQRWKKGRFLRGECGRVLDLEGESGASPRDEVPQERTLHLGQKVSAFDSRRRRLGRGDTGAVFFVSSHNLSNLAILR
jgi:hypothetical protein